MSLKEKNVKYGSNLEKNDKLHMGGIYLNDHRWSLRRAEKHL